MFETLKRLYEDGQLPIRGLSKAVGNGWITPEQYKEVTGKTHS